MSLNLFTPKDNGWRLRDKAIGIAALIAYVGYVGLRWESIVTMPLVDVAIIHGSALVVLTYFVTFLLLDLEPKY